MEKEFVLYEQAQDLKELGFDEPCFGFFNIKGKFIKDFGITKDIMDSLGLEHLELVDNICLAPTFSQAFRWFREKYKIYHSIDGLEGSLYYNVRAFHNEFSKLYLTYEEAEIECLKKLIELIKEK